MPLPRKPGIEPGSTVAVLGAPEGFAAHGLVDYERV